MDYIEVIKRQELLALMKDMPFNTLALAYVYAKNYVEFGEDVTERWLTTTENVAALEKAYKRGYYDALQQSEERRSA